MKFFELVKNPFFKWIGIALILYFALFSNKEDPNSLGNRMSPQNIKKDLGDIKEKSQFIITNIKAVQDINVGKGDRDNSATTQSDAKITIEDLEDGAGDQAVACGNEATVSYGVYTESDKQLAFTNAEILNIGEKRNPIVEQNIIGMKPGGVRYINIPKDFKSNDPKLMAALRFNNGGLKYRITLINLKQGPGTPNLVCNF